jgi:hypothetical protein
MKFRFKPEQGFDACPIGSEADYIGGGETPIKVISIDEANAILEAKEKKCQEIEGHIHNWGNLGESFCTEECLDTEKFTHSALVWNLEPINSQEGGG